MSGWLGWLGGLLQGLLPDWWSEPEPGTHEARLHAQKLGALLQKELNKPREQRDEELAHTLLVKYRHMQLCNEQVGCCGAGGLKGARPGSGSGRVVAAAATAAAAPRVCSLGAGRCLKQCRSL